jgi:TolB-like protein/Flp pilus assembly protein TadD
MGLGLFDEQAVADGVGGSASPIEDSRWRKTMNAFGERVPPSRTPRTAKILGDFGDYELLEEIGRGGQGVVYRAHQKSLNRSVALKVIGRGPWTTERHLKRFRREAQAAAHLEHPGIVPIYEVGERDGQCYFSMKFVDGGQLDEVVRHSPISIRQAVDLIAKVARTVHYAHKHGILHRDIKPGNILLDKNGEPHLTDFGLARLVEAESTVTATLDVLGTPSYMAPEQASGEHRKVSKATDVYGLGAVLYQLLTGQPPFAGGTTYETIKLLLDTEPRQPRLLNPKIDRDLSTICLKCLEKDPQRRYPAAAGLAEDLEHWLRHEPIRAKPSGLFTHARKWVRRNPSTTVLATSLLAFAIGLGVMVWNREPAVIIPKSVAVLPFENLSEDPNSAYIGEGIQEEILTRLAKIQDLKVISRTSTQRYQSKPGNLAEISKQLGVANIVEGSVQRVADQVRVNVQLINAQTDSHLWGDSYDRKLTDILGVESEIAKRIAASLQAKLTGHEEQALAAKPTNNPEAYDAYLRGVAFEARSSSLRSRDLVKKAADFYERAVQLDPNFATAWARLSRLDAHFYFANFVDTTSAARGEAAKRALETSQKLDPNSAETLLALGYYQYRVLRDYGAAKTTFGRVSEMLPGSGEPLHALALVTRRDGNWDESLAYFERALTLDPRNIELLKDSAEAYADVRQFPAALKLFDRVLDITPNDPEWIAAKAGIYQAQGDLREAAGLLSGINEQASFAAFDPKILQLQFERNYSEAVRLLQARLAQFHYDSDYQRASNQVDLALTQRFAGDMVGAKVTAEQACSTLEQLDKDQPDNVGRGVIIGPTSQIASRAVTLSQAYAVMGDKDLALKTAERAIMLLPSAKDRVWGPTYEENLAQIQTIFGDDSSAISTLTRLLQMPYGGWPAPITPARLRLDPTWDPLRGNPAFRKLCEEKIDKSIAILPFENLSRDPDNAYFAEGIQEEILTRLAKIADLKVISRTSTQRYQSKPDDLGEIAKELGVANVLEGSVQKTADQVHVNVQLINVQTESYLWADIYDRKLTDILGAESEIAKRIAESLQAKLTGQEEQALTVKPTNNPDAYDAYLRGLAFEARNYFSSYSQDLEREVAAFYERAVQRDPNFAIAWARLCHTDALIYVNPHQTAGDSARGDAAKHALEQAQKLDPESPETLLAFGYYQYMVLHDNELAKTTWERVGKMLPGSNEVRRLLAIIARRDGHWDQSIALLEEALALDPRNVQLLDSAIWTYTMLRQFPAALKLLDRMLDIMPNDPDVMATKASIYQAQGNLPEAARLLSGINEQSPNGFGRKINQLQLERNYSEAIRLQRARLAQFHYASEFARAGDQENLAVLQRLAGDTAGAKVTAEQARNTLEQLYRDQPSDAFHAMMLAGAYALMGEKDSALKAAERAFMLRVDETALPVLKESLAEIQTLVGENSRAISILTQLLQTPYWAGSNSTPITPALLMLDPIWDPLRSDPAFQKLCEEKQP